MSASLTDGDPDEMIRCPYDPVHLLRRKRMPYHIMKCAKNNNMRDFRVCPFNYRHIVPKAQFDMHLNFCEDRGMLEREMMFQQEVASEDLAPMQKGYTDLPVSTFVPPEPEESWDDSNVVVEINPRLKLFTSKEGAQETRRSPQTSPTKKTSKVREPPNLRDPVMTRGSDSEVFKLATARVQDSPLPPVMSRGRGRGRGIVIPSDKPGELASRDVQGSTAPPVLGRGLGRGRGLILATPEVAAAAPQETKEEEAARKKEKKLRKMLRQILELEEKLEEGQSLNEDQRAKLARKEDVLSMLEQFHM